MKKVFIIIILLISLSLFGEGKGKIIGKVVDLHSGYPLPYCVIFLEGTKVGALSDAEGKFEIRNIEPGVYNIICELMGHKDERIIDVNMFLNSDIEVLFYLEPRSAGYSHNHKRSNRKKVKRDKTTSSIIIIPNETENLRSHPYKYDRKQINELNLRMEVNLHHFNSKAYNYSNYKFAKSGEIPFVKTDNKVSSSFNLDIGAQSYHLMKTDLGNRLLPHKRSIRTEEFINYFDYNFGTAVIHDSSAIDNEVTVCPWNRKNKLARISLLTGNIELKELSDIVIFNPKTVEEFRLIGYEVIPTRNIQNLKIITNSISIKPQTKISAFYEIVPKQN